MADEIKKPIKRLKEERNKVLRKRYNETSFQRYVQRNRVVPIYPANKEGK